MINLQARDKQALRSLLQSPTWKVIETVVAYQCTNIQQRERVGESEWDTVRNTIGADHEVRGIRQLIQNIVDLAHE